MDSRKERLVIDQEQFQRDVKFLKDKAQEQTYLNKADAIFGRYLRNGRKAASQIADLLYDSLEKGQVSDAEITQVLAADLLWTGEERQTKLPLILVMEASWLAEVNDVERTATRAAILRRIGLNALAVVGGEEWTDAARAQALREGVVTTTNGSIDSESWQTAGSAIRS